jgi:transposase
MAGPIRPRTGVVVRWPRNRASAKTRCGGLGISTGSSRTSSAASGCPGTSDLSKKLTEVVGLYLNPPDKALVLCVDGKSQIQALDRTQPGLPMKKGRCGPVTHDYVRHGTTTLFAALNVLEGTVVGECLPRHRHQEFLKFPSLLDREFPEPQELHLIVDNYATHKHARVKQWLNKHPRFHWHFTPTSSSWLNLVERWFRELTDRAIRRGVFVSVPDLIETIESYVASHNASSKPFVWTATVDAILAKLAKVNAVYATLH